MAPTTKTVGTYTVAPDGTVTLNQNQNFTAHSGHSCGEDATEQSFVTYTPTEPLATSVCGDKDGKPPRTQQKTAEQPKKDNPRLPFRWSPRNTVLNDSPCLRKSNNSIWQGDRNGKNQIPKLPGKMVNTNPKKVCWPRLASLWKTASWYKMVMSNTFTRRKWPPTL